MNQQGCRRLLGAEIFRNEGNLEEKFSKAKSLDALQKGDSYRVAENRSSLNPNRRVCARSYAGRRAAYARRHEETVKPGRRQIFLKKVLTRFRPFD